MFKSTPTAKSVGTSDEPPYEMNGSGMPFVGSSASTTLMLKSACATMPVTMPTPEQHPEPVRRAQRRAHPAPQKSPKSATTAEPAEQPQLLADHREDEVRVRERQEEQSSASLP